LDKPFDLESTPVRHLQDLHWIDSETQALLGGVVESLPTAQLLLLVNYRPEYQHGCGSKTYYTQIRLDPLPQTGAVLHRQIRCVERDDPRGTKYVIEGSAVDQSIFVGVVGRFTNTGR
jgi:hypothetical protein